MVPSTLPPSCPLILPAALHLGVCKGAGGEWGSGRWSDLSKVTQQYADSRYIGQGFYCWLTISGSCLNICATYKDLFVTGSD